jgi:uncharacterized protein YggT (Ycf19 family)
VGADDLRLRLTGVSTPFCIKLALLYSLKIIDVWRILLAVLSNLMRAEKKEIYQILVAIVEINTE